MTKQSQQCEWFEKCGNMAVTTRTHPILGEVPICRRCDDRMEVVESDTPQITAWECVARESGRAAAERAASWAVGGNTTAEHCQRVLKMMEDGDPAVEHFLPRRPNMSGEYADAPTTNSVIEEATGKPEEQIYDEDREAILNAWEDGVSERFESACEEEFRKVVA